MSGRVVRKLTHLVAEVRRARQGRAHRRKEAYDERLAQKVAADAEARRAPYNHPGGAF